MNKSNWWKRAIFAFMLCATTAIPLPAQTFTSLFSFDGTDGRLPEAALVQGVDGSFYGTTVAGGANDDGTVFKITPAGTLTALYSFCSQTGCTDGELPYAGLIQAADGNFYGTTVGGGANNSSVCDNNGCGTIFKITPSGILSSLYSFCSQSGCTDGIYPYARLIQATDGNFYGTALEGGADNAGTVFEITPNGTLATLHTFDGTDGANPGALVQARDGNFYGTTSGGGANEDGTVFEITPSGTLTTLYSFCSYAGCPDGAYPGALVQARDGNFYGTTGGGGANGQGTIFKITPSGTLSRLYSFHSTPYSAASLVQATDGNFYATTETGGLNDGGTVFKITPNGTLTKLYSFCFQSGCPDGEFPEGALVQATNGNFYGTTSSNYGTVFSLSVGLAPFVETEPTSGKVGEPVKILGTNLTGVTSVTFNGTAATFTVDSHSLITTTVPAGATTGTVEVVTPSGTLSSNVPFRVRQ